MVLGLEALRRQRYRRLAVLGATWGVSTALAALWPVTTTSGRDVLGTYWVDGMAPLSFREYGWYWSRAVRLVQLDVQADGPPLRFTPLDGFMWPQIMLAVATLAGLVYGLRQFGPLGDISRVAVLSLGCAEGKRAVTAISEFAPIVQSAEHLSAGVYLFDFNAAFAERCRQAQTG